MHESEKVFDNYEMITDPVTGEQKKSLLPTVFQGDMSQSVADYRGFAFEMNEKDPWFMFFSRVGGLVLLVMTLGNSERKGQYLGLSLALLDLSLTINAHKPEMGEGDLKMIQSGIVVSAVILFALAFRQ